MDLYAQLSGSGFSNGYVPLFAIIGKEYKVYYDDNDSGWDSQLQLAITEMVDLAAPAAVTDFNYTADPSGGFSCDLSWTNPTQTVGGDPLSSLDAVKIYRNNEVINTISSPTVGGADSYTDNGMTEAGLYMYKIVAENGMGEGLSVTANVYVGEDTPGAVTELTLENNNGMADLTWVNPVVGAHEGYFVPNSITSYTIIRNDGEEYTLNGMATSYTDQAVAAAGDYSYTVIANNGIGAGAEAVSNMVQFVPAGTLCFEGFANFPPDGWTVEGGNWHQGSGNNAGGTAPEANFNWNPGTVATQYLITKPLDTTGETKVNLKFNHMIDYYGAGYDCKIVTSTDMATWNVVHTFDNTQNIGPELFTMDIENSDVGSSTFYVAFEFSGDSYQIDDWFIDNVVVSLAVDVEENNMIDQFSLEQNYPNPFNPSTTINFSVNGGADVNLTVYNSNGELVQELVDNNLENGAHSIKFDGSNLNSGVYFYKLSVNGMTETKKMILVK